MLSLTKGKHTAYAQRSFVTGRLFFNRHVWPSSAFAAAFQPSSGDPFIPPPSKAVVQLWPPLPDGSGTERLPCSSHSRPSRLFCLQHRALSLSFSSVMCLVGVLFLKKAAVLRFPTSCVCLGRVPFILFFSTPPLLPAARPLLY